MLAALVAIVAWQAKTWEPSTAAGSGNRAGVASATSPQEFGPLTLFPPGARPNLPTVEGTTLQGTHLDLRDLSGHVLVLNVWASWCPPCRKEAPILSRVAALTADQGVRFVGIDTRDTTVNANAFVRTFDIRYPSLVDTDGQLLLAFRGLIPLAGIPITMVVDKTGGIVARVVGPVDYPMLRGLVTDALNTPSLPATSGGS